ncbi:hypothetical protein K9N08_00100 [Candidatus Gracilibacteria bacterium]|nr:hypothetical protein [Candidatus Gracilibacteria bacterium]MCF7855951.1 hypothetical protein [Candidatus Gracilibacteria bacterium]MCF7896356.1 hypothetical protein [Candidatus Gracilibacteria bacterium]
MNTDFLERAASRQADQKPKDTLVVDLLEFFKLSGLSKLIVSSRCSIHAQCSVLVVSPEEENEEFSVCFNESGEICGSRTGNGFIADEAVLNKLKVHEKEIRLKMDQEMENLTERIKKEVVKITKEDINFEN